MVLVKKAGENDKKNLVSVVNCSLAVENQNKIRNGILT